MYTSRRRSRKIYTTDQAQLKIRHLLCAFVSFAFPALSKPCCVDVLVSDAPRLFVCTLHLVFVRFGLGERGFGVFRGRRKCRTWRFRSESGFWVSRGIWKSKGKLLKSLQSTYLTGIRNIWLGTAWSSSFLKKHNIGTCELPPPFWKLTSGWRELLICCGKVIGLQVLRNASKIKADVFHRLPAGVGAVKIILNVWPNQAPENCLRIDGGTLPIWK